MTRVTTRGDAPILDGSSHQCDAGWFRDFLSRKTTGDGFRVKWCVLQVRFVAARLGSDLGAWLTPDEFQSGLRLVACETVRLTARPTAWF